MAKLRRILASISLVAILSTLVVSQTAFAGQYYDDVADDVWFAPFVNELAAGGHLNTGVDNYNPGDNMTRAQSSKLLVGVGGLAADLPDSPTFLDVPMSYWGFEYVETAFANNVVNGYSGDLAGYFGPDDPITREQFAKMSVLAFDLPMVEGCDYFTDASSISDWACDYVGTAYHWSVIDGYPDGSFGPGLNINRAEGAKMVVNSANPVAREDMDDVGDDVEDDVVVEGGDLYVDVNDDTPDGATLPANATSVPVAAFDFTAGDEDATIKSLEVHRYGVSDLASDHQVYLYHGSERLTSGKSVNSTTNMATFNNLNYAIDAGDTDTLTVRMDVGATAATGEVGFEIEDADAVTAGGDVDGDFPAQGDLFGLSTTSAGTITITKNGTVTDASVGEKGSTIAKFKVEAATENASVEELGVYVTGTINTSDVDNFKLYAAGETDPVAEVDTLNSRDVAMFVLDDPYAIDKGDTRSFWVTADFNTGRTGDTVLVYIDETTDVVAIGDKYGYGMGVTATTYDGTTCTTTTPTECNAMTLEGGDITISGSTITNRNIAVNQDDVAIMRFTVTSLSDIMFNNFSLFLDTDDSGEGLLTGTTANYTDIKINEVDGDHVWGPIDSNVLKDNAPGGTGDGAITDGNVNEDQASYYLFTDDLFMDAGESKEFEVTLDVANTAALADDTITAGIYISTNYPEIKDVNNKVLTNSSSLVPTSSYTGDAFTVKADSIGVSLSSSVGSTTEVIGSQDVELAAFSVSAGDASGLKVTSLKFTGYIDDDADNTFVAGQDTAVYFNEIILNTNLYEGSVAEENKINTSAKSANTAGEFTFDNLNWNIPEGETVTVIVAGDIANNSTYAADVVKVDIADVSADVIAENDDGNSVTSTSADTPNGGTANNNTRKTISAGGTLAIDIPSATPTADIIVAGSTNNNMAVLKFSAEDEDFTIDKMYLKNSRPDYDDNIAAVKVKYYTDVDQTVEETKTCTSQGSTLWKCTGMNVKVPNPDVPGNPNYAYVTVMADLKTAADGQADAGDLPGFTFTPAGDFEATADSGRKFYEQTVYVTDLGATDSYTTYADYADSGRNAAGADLDTTGTDKVLTLGGAASAIPGGSIVCIDSDVPVDGCDATDEMAYVVASCTAGAPNPAPHADCTSANDLILTRGLWSTTKAATTAVADIYYVTSATTLATNTMAVYGTKLTFANGTAAGGGQNTSQEVMKYTIAANDLGDGRIRQGKTLTTAALGVDADGTVGNAEATTQLDGASSKWTLAVDAGDSIYFDAGATGILDDYSRVSFWVYTDDAGAQAVDKANLKVSTDTLTTAVGANATAIGSGNITDNTWTLIDMAMPAGVVAGDQYFHFELDAVGNLADADFIIIDDLKFYNEKVTVDLTLNAAIAGATGTTAYLKQNGTVVATGVATWYDAASPSNGTIVFIPVGTYADIELTDTTTFTVEMDTTVFADGGTSTENLTLTTDLGYRSAAGDFYWYDVEGATTVNYAGKTATDKVTNTTSY